MVEIRRTDYLERLEQLAAAPVVVALLGLRRVGKSVVLLDFLIGESLQ